MKTIKMRFAVAIFRTAKGWKTYGEGANGMADSEIKEWVTHSDCTHDATGPVHWRFVEAEIPIPEDDEITIAGKVER